MEILILGPGCRNCQTLEQLVKDTAADLDLGAVIRKVTDYAGIASYGIMTTPALVIDEEVVLSGRVPSATEIREILSARAG